MAQHSQRHSHDSPQDPREHPHAARYTRKLEARWTRPPMREQTGDLHPLLLAQEREDALTARLPTPQEVERLKRLWRVNPTFDVEYASGFELMRDELAAWHDEQVRERAAILGCSPLMAAIVEELVHCWIDCRPPASPLARRVLLSFR